ncbi:hypothetical protein [Mycobacterium tilburgii]|uniref:hypothetical protein n=1 Tax=Mycobacterium tilburgii TaxID=44467 RepID=UPI0021B330CC|nr:hypothetical protein [Mycobacterium tilburgii]
MRIRWTSTASLLAAVLVAGCTFTVGGHAVAAPNLKPHPVIDQQIKQVLLDGVAL